MKMDEKAVSPVIGVILLVAITVILASLIASFVFSIGSQRPQTVPNAQLLIVAGPGKVIVKHVGGEALKCNELNFMLDGNPKTCSECTGWLSVGGSCEISPVSAGSYEVSVIHIPSQMTIAQARITVYGT